MISETLENLYYENLYAFKSGKITEEVWANFCRNILCQIMTDSVEAKKEH